MPLAGPRDVDPAPHLTPIRPANASGKPESGLVPATREGRRVLRTASLFNNDRLRLPCAPRARPASELPTGAAFGPRSKSSAVLGGAGLADLKARRRCLPEVP